LFWFAVAVSWLIKNGVFGETLATTADGMQLGFAFLGYLIFALVLTVGSTTTNKVLFIDFIFIDLLLLGLTLDSFGIVPHFSHSLAGWSELIISIISFYGFAAMVLNQHIGKTLLPLGKPVVVFKK